MNTRTWPLLMADMSRQSLDRCSSPQNGHNIDSTRPFVVVVQQFLQQPNEIGIFQVLWVGDIAQHADQAIFVEFRCGLKCFGQRCYPIVLLCLHIWQNPQKRVLRISQLIERNYVVGCLAPVKRVLYVAGARVRFTGAAWFRLNGHSIVGQLVQHIIVITRAD